MIKRSALLLAILIFVGRSSEAQDSKLEQLLRTTPQVANSAAYINVPALRTLLAEGTLKGELANSVSEIRVISQLDLKSLEPKWEIGDASMAEVPTVESLARVVGGYVDTVLNKQVVWSPKQSYLIPGEFNNLKFVRPADRKLLSGWMSGDRIATAAPYLLQQCKQPEQFLSLMIAIDLENYLSPVALAKRASNLETLKGVDAASIAKTLASCRGLTIIVGRRSLSECMLTLEFANSPDELLPYAGKMLSEILARNGSPVPEVAGWLVKAQGNSLTYQGALSEISLEALLGIFSLKDQANELNQQLNRKSAADIDPILEASKAYFDKVVTNVNRARNHNIKDAGAQWNSQIARTIDGIGTLNVDPDLVQYAAEIASLLRGNSLTIQQANISAAAQRAQGTYYSESYYDPNAYYSYDNSRVINAQARAVGATDFRAIVVTMDQKTADMRRAMTAKYKKQF